MRYLLSNTAFVIYLTIIATYAIVISCLAPTISDSSVGHTSEASEPLTHSLTYAVDPDACLICCDREFEVGNFCIYQKHFVEEGSKEDRHSQQLVKDDTTRVVIWCIGLIVIMATVAIVGVTLVALADPIADWLHNRIRPDE